MASKPKIVQQASPEEIQEKANALAQQEANQATATKRKLKKSTVLASLSGVDTTALTKTNTGT